MASAVAFPAHFYGGSVLDTEHFAAEFVVDM